MHYFLRNYGMDAKIHHYSIRLHVLSRTTQVQLPSFTFMVLYSKGLWFWMLRLTAAPNWRFFIADAMNFLSFPTTSIIEQPARNQYWSALRSCFPWKCCLSHSVTTCSKIFPIVSSMQNSQNEVGFPTGLPGFCNSTSLLDHLPSGRECSTFQNDVENSVEYPRISPLYDSPHTV